MSATYAPGTEAVLQLGEVSVPVVVVHDDGGETVVVSYPHPHLEGKASRVPVLCSFVSCREAQPRG